MAEIKIRGDISGSTTIKAPDSGSDEVIELSSELASKLPYSFGTATPSTTDSGFLWYDTNSTPAAPKFWDGAAFQALTSGKILQVVRVTDSTNRTTTSTSFVDASISVTITPQKSDSSILLIWTSILEPANNTFMFLQITDSANNPISGANSTAYGTNAGGIFNSSFTQIAYSSPATTSSVTYKGRFRTASGTATIYNSNPGQMYAIEVSA